MRRNLDQYFTDEKLTFALLDRVPIAGTVFEPCVGRGNIVRATIAHAERKRTAAPRWTTNDIDPQFPADFHEDAANQAAIFWQDTYDWILTNAPFKQINRILPVAFLRTRKGVAFLNRWSYLEPAGNRAVWLDAHKREMSNLIIFGQPRPSYSEDGQTDTVTTAWMVWRPGWTHGTDIDFVYKWQE